MSDDRISKIADDVSYIKAKIEELPRLRSDVDELKSKADKSIGFLAAYGVFSGGIGASLAKLFGIH